MKGFGLVVPVILSACVLAACGAARGRWNPGTDTGVAIEVPRPVEGFTVAILGDRTGGDESGLLVLERAVEELNLLRPDLVLHIGDIVPGYIRDMAQWQDDIARVKAILDRLEAPLFAAAGNHDVITGTGDTSDRRGEELHKRHFGPLYYSFDYRNAHFVCLYTEETLQSRPRLSQAQLDWLRRDLDACRARHVFVLMHKPLWEYEDAGWDEVHELLRRHPVRAVFGGHFHHYYRSNLRDGIQYYVLGVTGGRRYSPELAGGLEHYCLLRVEPDAYHLALVKPGHVLPDDYIDEADYKAMERLRWLSGGQTGVVGAVRSPELGPVDSEVPLIATNPLEVPLRVGARGLARGGNWTFGDVPQFTLGPGEQARFGLPVGSPRVAPGELVPPDVEIEYTYVDAQGRTVPIALRRRVPLRREAAAPLGEVAVSLDGRADEAAWGAAPLLTAAVWQASAYETGQAEPVLRVLPAPGGIYVHTRAVDPDVSDFRGERMLSDAVFVGAVPSDAEAGTPDEPAVVILFPFATAGSERAMRARWDARQPQGQPVEGVQLRTERSPDGRTWTCEAFVPWAALLGAEGPPGEELRLNVGVWDNDGDLFTELHTWAPTGSVAQWGLLRLTRP